MEIGVTTEVPIHGRKRIVLVAVEVGSGGAMLLAPYEVLHLSSVIVEVCSAIESASVSVAKAEIIKYVNIIVVYERPVEAVKGCDISDF